MTRRFYETVYTVRILSEDTPLDCSLEAMAEAIDSGDCVGVVDIAHREITSHEAARALSAFGSEPGFFNLNTDGKDLSDWEWYGIGVCDFCKHPNVELVAVLTADPDQRVCAACHADPRVPTEERDEERHAADCVCADCAGAELTAEND